MNAVDQEERKLYIVIFIASACLFNLEIIMAQIFEFLRISSGMVQVLPVAFLGLGIGGIIYWRSAGGCKIKQKFVAITVSWS